MLYLDKIRDDKVCLDAVPDYENPLVTLYDSSKSEYYEARLNMIGKPVRGITKENKLRVLRRYNSLDRSLEKVVDVTGTYAYNEDSIALDVSVNGICPNFVDVFSPGNAFGTVYHIIEKIVTDTPERLNDIKNDVLTIYVMDMLRSSKIAISVKILDRNKFNAICGKLILVRG